MPEREALFHATVAPTPRPTVFDVREVVTDRDFAGIGTVFAGAHDYDPSLVATMWGPRLLGPCRARGWLAWDAAEPVSCVFVTRVGSSLGVFDMLTSARHRRRGAARALLARALTEVAHGESTDSIAFWASPAGRPLYESMGFAIADSVHVWTLGASPEDLAAVGAG